MVSQNQNLKPTHTTKENDEKKNIILMQVNKLQNFNPILPRHGLNGRWSQGISILIMMMGQVLKLLC